MCTERFKAARDENYVNRYPHVVSDVHYYPTSYGLSLSGNVLIQKRYFLELSAGLTQWNQRIQGSTQVSYEGVYYTNSQGLLKIYYPISHYTLDYDESVRYLRLSVGLGVHLLPKTCRFSIMPILRFNPEFKVWSRLNKMILTEEHQPYNELYVPFTYPAHTSLITGDTIGSDIKLSYVFPSIGIRMAWTASSNLGFQIESGLGMLPYSRLIVIYQEQSRNYWYLNFGMHYILSNSKDD